MPGGQKKKNEGVSSESVRCGRYVMFILPFRVFFVNDINHDIASNEEF